MDIHKFKTAMSYALPRVDFLPYYEVVAEDEGDYLEILDVQMIEDRIVIKVKHS